MESKTTYLESRRVLMWSLPLLAVLCIAGLAFVAHALLWEPETPGVYPPQYYDFGHAYPVDPDRELGIPITVRRDGGGDDDYLQLPFLNNNDLVTVHVEQNQTMFADVDYWCSDPGKFPIFERYFSVNPHSTEFGFDFQFAAVVSGTYYIHTGQGMGDTWINFTITRVASTPPGGVIVGNDKPANKVVLAADVPHTEDGGLPWDPSDFFSINVQPTAQNNKYLSIHLSNDTGTVVNWELYSTATVQRPSEAYMSDQLAPGTAQDSGHPLVDWPVPASGDYYIRIWVRGGYGSYTVTLGVLTYPNDANNSIEEAYQVYDPRIASYDHLDADVNLSFDMDDFDMIFLEAGQPLYVRMIPDKGPADLFLQDADGNQVGKSDNPGLEEEQIYNFRPDEAGFYYILVSAVYEDTYPNPLTVTYTLWVWINYAPNVVKGAPPKYSMPEDLVNDTISVADWFEDKDGDALTYDMDMSYNSTRVEITLSDGHLRIAPRANESGFSIKVLVNATDIYGLMVNWTVTITITPVNDAPYVDPNDVPSEISIGEDLVKSGVNVTKPFRDIDDDYTTWKFTATTTTHVQVELDPITWLATFTPLVKDWNGTEYFTVTCTDSGGLNATVQYKIVVFEINDPPIIVPGGYIPQITMKEEGTFTYNLEDPAKPAFKDIEGRPLTYAWANNGSVMVSVENGVLTLTGIKDYSGIITGMQLWAIDDLLAKSANMTLLITVNEIDDAPELEVLKATATVQEGQGVKFDPDVYYKLIDPDSLPIELDWKWFVNEVEVPPSQITDRFAYEYIPAVTAEKDRTVTVRLEVIGESGGDNATFTVSVTNKNAAPNPPQEPSIVPPPEKDGSLVSGKKYTFTTNSSDIDNDAITYEWFLDETTSLGTGPSITVSLSTGSHKITVKATDPSGASSTRDLIVNVVKGRDPNGDPGFEGVALVAALAVVAVVAIALRRRH